MKIEPDNSTYLHGQNYGVETKVREEREATERAFKEWVQAHAACVRSERVTYPPYSTAPTILPERERELEPAAGTA